MLVPAAGSVLLLVDLQQRLMPAISGGDEVVANSDRLARAAGMMDVPIVATEQNPAGLGPTVQALAGYPRTVLPKTSFAATSEPTFDTLLPPDTEHVVVAGCEAHVCVLQTVVGLRGRGYRVLLVGDAVGSRTTANRDAALARAREHGAEVLTTEMVLFEWLEHSGHPRFRDVQRLIT
ncbi:isochorismatase family protein [Pseudonocardia endophytica]|uniref:Nicotinamidase-related amidase n=1 Tax=Pseudonocardia endophytica TaxID=401976 RepID=A0A4R1HUV0_PSEEN|nr:isochorismatase family protein [Pseudonocardia endophytica]TCK21222.1 nicotinamidase-related amidase [Pseudonocardia endophytica]